MQLCNTCQFRNHCPFHRCSASVKLKVCIYLILGPSYFNDKSVLPSAPRPFARKVRLEQGVIDLLEQRAQAEKEVAPIGQNRSNEMILIAKRKYNRNRPLQFIPRLRLVELSRLSKN